MNVFAWIAGAFCAIAALAHIVSTAVVMLRFRREPATPKFGCGPRVSLIRPVRGLENCIEDTLRSGFELSHANFEMIFCVADAGDPVVPLIERLLAGHPDVAARLLIGDDRISPNPKLNNLMKGVRAARHEWLLFADSNVLMPRDYIERTLAVWRADTGLVCSPPAASHPVGFWAEVEAGFLNSHQARWQYAADTAGFGFAQGKTMLWRRTDLERAGGLPALAAEVAEDAAATKAVRALGLRVRLVGPPFPQPLGVRGFTAVWQRQARWAQLRRASFPQYFTPEILTGGILPMLAAGVVAMSAELPVGPAMLTFALLWYGCEALLVRAAGWPLSMLSPPAWIARDVMMPAVWLYAWLARDFVWRGNPMRSRERNAIAQTARALMARLTAS